MLGARKFMPHTAGIISEDYRSHDIVSGEGSNILRDPKDSGNAIRRCIVQIGSWPALDPFSREFGVQRGLMVTFQSQYYFNYPFHSYPEGYYGEGRRQKLKTRQFRIYGHCRVTLEPDLVSGRYSSASKHCFMILLTLVYAFCVITEGQCE
jgi:hypothetical protein